MFELRFAVESWAPEYGTPVDLEPDTDKQAPEVDLSVESPADAWRPIAPAGDAAASALFVDGVRHIDARIWAFSDDEMPSPGLCASYAAGAVRCDGRATVEGVLVEHGTFGLPGLPVISAGTATYTPFALPTPTLQTLMNELQQRLGELEIRVAVAADPADLVVIDGPLSGREYVTGAIGYIKSHQAPYLDPEHAAVVSALNPGERTPVFLTRTTWSRYSWYLRLPGASGHPWAGVTRCEAAASLPIATVVERANLSAATLPRFASQSHKEPRAPQNLYPISGLERELRRRLGDRELLYRGLRAAAR